MWGFWAVPEKANQNYELTVSKYEVEWEMLWSRESTCLRHHVPEKTHAAFSIVWHFRLMGVTHGQLNMEMAKLVLGTREQRDERNSIYYMEKKI